MLFEFIETQSDSMDYNLYDDTEGFEKGNMFKNLYDPYKNYDVKKIVPKNEREMLMLNILKLSFALNDLNLYLDLNPNDQEVYELFKKYSLMYQKYLEQYEQNYQVLELCHDIYGKYTWLDNPWPWEDKYV